MKKFLNRKTVLLGLIAVFLCVYILQISLGGKNSMEILTVKNEIDCLKISYPSNPEKDVTLEKKDGVWVWGNYATNEALIKSFENAVASIKVLGTATSSGDRERYDLTDEKIIKVEALSGGKTVRTICIGKDTPNGTQCYALIDGSSSVQIIAQGLKSLFTFTKDAIRTKTAYSVGISLINSIHIKNADGEYTLKKVAVPQTDTEIPQTKWFVVGKEEMELDQSKVVFFVDGISSMTANSWLSDDAEPTAAEPIAVAELSTADETVTVMTYPPEKGSMDNVVKCSTSPYLFKTASGNAEAFKRTVESFLPGADSEE